MNTETKQPRYFRLLEKGEIIENGDYRIDIDRQFVPTLNMGLVAGEPGCDTSPYFRPVAVDPWIEYSKQKPTKDDFEPTGYIECYNRSAIIPFFCQALRADGYPKNNAGEVIFWRHCSAPQQPKPKIVTLNFTNRGTSQDITPNPDGTAKLGCGDTISAESIDQFIKAREEIMDNKKGLCF